MTWKELLEYDLINIGGYHLNLVKIGSAVIIVFAVQLVIWLINRLLRAYFRRHDKVDLGRQYAVRQFIKYILYFVTALLVLETVGIKMSVIWAGAAALLVGAGLGLQQAVSDLFSGILLLTEGTVEVGDVVVVDGLVGKVVKIGLRASKVETRDRVVILIPNSKLVMNNVTNWSHSDVPARFDSKVGVAYSSDTRLVERLLLQAATENQKVLKKPEPSVQFVDFGQSSLDFRLLFYSQELMPIEFVKSDLRFRIIDLFREHKVEIPFPQHDLWLRNYNNSAENAEEKAEG